VNISIVGTGYVGIVSGTCLAAKGHCVTCVDTKSEIVAQINRGVAPVYEPGLQKLLAHAVINGKLRATTDCRNAVLDTDVTVICVGTPTAPSGMDLTQVISASKSIGYALAEKNTYHVVAVKSTVLPGTTEDSVNTALEKTSGRRVGDGWGLCMNPEFLREGHAVNDFIYTDRVVIGTSDKRAAEVLLDMYRHLDCLKIVTSLRTAEMIKYAANSLFATLISYSNEIANLCKAAGGIDVREMWRGVHLDRRLTPISRRNGNPAGVVEYLWHGLGFGGSCFPKDVAALRQLGKHLGEETLILDAVLTINAMQPLQVVSLLEKETEVTGQRVAILGLAFKPGTDDIRESPAIPIVTALRQRGAMIIAHDPAAIPQARRHTAFESVTFVNDYQAALTGADACCIVTSWPEYKAIAPGVFSKLMRRPLVIDGRGLYDPDVLAIAGVEWRGIGYEPGQNRSSRKEHCFKDQVNLGVES
jgi:UDPglucose 6-dehydrogenase